MTNSDVWFGRPIQTSELGHLCLNWTSEYGHHVTVKMSQIKHHVQADISVWGSMSELDVWIRRLNWTSCPIEPSQAIIISVSSWVFKWSRLCGCVYGFVERMFSFIAETWFPPTKMHIFKVNASLTPPKYHIHTKSIYHNLWKTLPFKNLKGFKVSFTCYGWRMR